ncbi:MAG TPA: dienelactone hydrolase family protein [Acidimicrobiales bacterium]|nr:dienelactone hydrolase family protein [Acidimicrobiales bacterium]
METTTFEVPTADGPMPVYRARPDGSPRGGVLVVQEAFGVNSHIEDVTRRFAAEGYLAMAPHFFHRSGGGTVAYGDFGAVMPHFKELSDERILADIDATLGAFSEDGVSLDRVGVVGFCFGGRVSFLAAVDRSLGAAVGFYGGGIVSGRSDVMPALVDRIGEMYTPWLGLFGDRDAHIPVDDVEKLKAALKDNAKVDAEVVRYPDADHGFHCDERESYHPDSAADGWKRTLEWLSNHLPA